MTTMDVSRNGLVAADRVAASRQWQKLQRQQLQKQAERTD